MLLGIKDRLERLQDNLQKGKAPEKLPISGTLAVIDGPLDFPYIDGYIQFMKIVLDNVPKAYGEQNAQWQSYLDRIYNMAEKLKNKNTRFVKDTKEEFPEYCEKLSHIFEIETKLHLKVPSLDIETSDNLIPFMQKHVDAGNKRGFYYKPEEDAKKELMHELMEQLSGLKFEKGDRRYDISRFLIKSGYHEHVADALNVLIQAAVYTVNCSSTREQKSFSFDRQAVHNQLRFAESIMERVKFLV